MIYYVGTATSHEVREKSVCVRISTQEQISIEICACMYVFFSFMYRYYYDVSKLLDILTILAYVN